MFLILIADDSWIARMSLNKILKPLPVTLLEAEDGAMAMEMIRKENPDLILLDLLMPEMDGIDILRLMREESIDIPVIVFSADIMEETEKEVISLGALAFIHKPSDPDLLLDTIKKIAGLDIL
ncbi:MAG: response regulator [Spirochaetales bacterium]|nr:response regulator [Spirochaetales bacterium]